MNRLFLALVIGSVFAGCVLRVGRGDRHPPPPPPEGRSQGPIYAPAPSEIVRAKEIKASVVRARVIYAKEIHARGGSIGRTHGRDERHERWGDNTLRAHEVAADEIHAKEIHADEVYAEVVYVKEVKLGR